MYNLGETIAKLRKEAGMTQEALANLLGVSSQAVSKWETGTTMPDVLMLPLIADAFGTNVDALYGRKSRSLKMQLTKDNLPEEMYKSFLEDMQHFWSNFDNDKDVDCVEKAKTTREMLKTYKNAQTMVYSHTEGKGVYADCDIALIFNKDKKEIKSLFEDETSWKVLKLFCEGETRNVFKFVLENRNKSYTSSFIAAKCGIDVEKVDVALQNLLELNLVARSDVETGDGTMYVYCAFALHKMLLVNAILTLAKRLGNYLEHYYGGFMS